MGRKQCLLFLAGREILIILVVQSIPSYAMSSLSILASIYDKISAQIRRFWSGGLEQKTKIHWKSGRVLGFPKSNVDILAKQCWRLVME